MAVELKVNVDQGNEKQYWHFYWKQQQKKEEQIGWTNFVALNRFNLINCKDLQKEKMLMVIVSA